MAMPAKEPLASATASSPISARALAISGESVSAHRIRWTQTPSPHSNIEGIMSFGSPNSNMGPGCSARAQCIMVGSRAPWARLVCTGPPAAPPRSRWISRAKTPMAAR